MMIALRGESPAARALRAAAVISVAVAALAAAQDAEPADEALKKGDIAEAKTRLEMAVKRNPADYGAALSYASTLPPKEALKLADSLSRAQNAPGWARALGLRFSGDHLFLKEDYKKAADAYMQASKLDSASTYKHLYALSISMDGRTEAARAIWNEIALDKTDELSGEAARILALLPKPAAPPPVAPPGNAPVSATAGAAKADDAKTPPLPPASTEPPVAPVNQQNAAAAQAPAAAPAGQPGGTPASAPKAPAAPPAGPKPAETVFTIQVGAFASKENADNLVKRLAGKYDDITVSSAASGDQMFYRVRVGTFQKKEDAVAFADKLIIEAGLSARVAEK